MGHLSTRIKFLVLIQQSPSVDGCVDAAAKILTEASILRPFGAKLLPGPILDFLAEAIKILDSREVTAPFGLWLVHRDGREHEGTTRRRFLAGGGRGGAGASAGGAGGGGGRGASAGGGGPAVTTAEMDVINLVQCATGSMMVKAYRNYGFHFIENGQKRGIIRAFFSFFLK
jgi:hypothetical protein